MASGGGARAAMVRRERAPVKVRAPLVDKWLLAKTRA
jgi:hypothetical protein